MKVLFAVAAGTVGFAASAGTTVTDWQTNARVSAVTSADGVKVTAADFRASFNLHTEPCVPEWREAPDRPGNLLFNSSFELGVKPAGVICSTLFCASPAMPTVTVDETTAAHGKRSVKIVVPAHSDASFLLPMALFTPEKDPKSRVYAYSLSMKADRSRNLSLALTDRYIDEERQDASSVNLWHGVGVSSEWRRFTWERIAIASARGRIAPRVYIAGPATVWIDAVQFEKTADGRATAYAPKDNVEATFDLDSHLYVSRPGAKADASFVAVRYAGETGKVAFRTTCGDFEMDLKPGETVRRAVDVGLDRKGIRTLEGTHAYPFDFGVVPEVPAYRGGFFLGLNGCTKTGGGQKDGSVRFSTTADHTLDDNYRDLRRYGMRMIRLHDDGMSMPDYAPRKGVYDFRALDVVLDKAKTNGLEAMYVFGSHGTFVNRRWRDNVFSNWYFRVDSKCVGKGPMGGRTYFNPDEGEWCDFIAATVRHCKGRIRWYEIVNEPNITVRNAETYARYLKLAFETIRREDPSALVVGVGSTGDFGSHAGTFVAQCGALGVFDNLDVVSYHPYDSPVDNPMADGERQALDIRAICERYRPGLRILQNENYYLTYPRQSDCSRAGLKDAVQTRWWPVGHLPRRHAIDLAAGEVGSMPLSGSQHFMGDAGQRGAVSDAAYFMPNDRFVASAAFAHFLQDGRPNGKPALPPELNGFVFLDRDGREVGMLWAREKAGRRTIPYPKGARVYDVFANPLAGETVEITENPVYVRGKNLKDLLSKGCR